MTTDAPVRKAVPRNCWVLIVVVLLIICSCCLLFLSPFTKVETGQGTVTEKWAEPDCAFDDCTTEFYVKVDGRIYRLMYGRMFYDEISVGDEITYKARGIRWSSIGDTSIANRFL